MYIILDHPNFMRIKKCSELISSLNNKNRNKLCACLIMSKKDLAKEFKAN